MKTRYCGKVKNNNSGEKSHIEKYLKEEIEFLLAPSAEHLLQVKWKDIYIPVESMEKKLREYLEHSISDRVLFFTGVTGSGKSMILKGVFEIFNMTPLIKDANLIIPFSFDNIHDTDEDSIKTIFSNMIMCACQILVSNYEVIKAEDNEADFYNFICRTRGDNANRGGLWPPQNISDQIKAYSEKAPIEFSSSLLKYYLNQEKVKINNVLFVVDDIEGIGCEQELFPVKNIYEVMTCMQNQICPRDWSIKVIIACRNYVYRIVTTRNLSDYEEYIRRYHQTLQSYAVTEQISLETKVSLMDIIEKRYEAISKTNKKEAWRTAMGIVKILLNEIDDSIGEFILKLNLGNIRNSLVVLKKMVFNKTWIQRDYNAKVDGAFKIDDVEEFDIKSVNLIRALALENNIVYSSSVSIIPNLFFNYGELTRDLYVLLTAKYFWKRKESMNWEASIDVKVFMERIKNIFGENTEYVSNFKWAVEYLIKDRMLLRSIDQPQEESADISDENVAKITKVYVAPALDELYERLNQNSILFEIYIDDIWMDNDKREYPPKMSRGFAYDKYLACLRYMHVIIEKENEVRTYVINKITKDKYIEAFGEDYLSIHLLEGLEKSFLAFYRNDDPNTRYEKDNLKKKIEKCRKKIVAYFGRIDR